MALLGPNGQPLGGPAPAPSTPVQDVEPPAPTRVTTAFLVYQTPNGQWHTSDDLATPVVPARKPGPDDVIGGAENIKTQIIARQTATMAARHTIETQLSMARQAQEAQQNAQIAQMLNGGK